MTAAVGSGAASFVIRSLQEGHWEQVREIYAVGIATGIATFETEVPSATDLDAKWISGQRWVAAHPAGQLLGWAALAPTSSRACYRGVAETSVYVAPEASGRGVGRALVRHQIDAAFAAGFWTLQSSVFAENHASRALHRALGFREVGIRERIAQRDGRWHGTVLIELRSTAKV